MERGAWWATVQGVAKSQTQLSSFTFTVYEPRGVLESERRGLDPWIGDIPGEENGYPLQYSYLENPMDRGAWWVIVHGVTKNQT